MSKRVAYGWMEKQEKKMLVDEGQDGSVRLGDEIRAEGMR